MSSSNLFLYHSQVIHPLFSSADVLFHLPKVLEAIRGCVDAKWKNEFFAFFPSAVKQKKYFSKWWRDLSILLMFVLHTSFSQSLCAVFQSAADIKPQSSMLSAIIKVSVAGVDLPHGRDHIFFSFSHNFPPLVDTATQYGQDHGRRQERLTEADIIYARKHLDAKLMKTLHYQHPKSDRG